MLAQVNIPCPGDFGKFDFYPKASMTIGMSKDYFFPHTGLFTPKHQYTYSPYFLYTFP